MKRRSIELSLAILMTVTCLGVTGCTGIIQPSIGESGIASSTESEISEGEELPAVGETENPEGEGDAAGASEGEDGDAAGASEGMDFGGGQESEPRPEMTGEVQVRFAKSMETSNSLGEKITLTATIELYDDKNADGYDGLIDIKLGESEAFTQCTWSEQDGKYILAIDEFTNYESKEIDGECTIVGVRYSFGMNGKGTIDIPLESGSAEPTEDKGTVEETEPANDKAAEKATELEEDKSDTEKTQETIPETETVEESTEGM